MNRRSFLALFGAAAAGLLVGDYDPSRLSWLAPAGVAQLPAPGEMVRDVVRRVERPMPEATLSLTQMTRDILRETYRQLGSPPDLLRVQGWLIGHAFPIYDPVESFIPFDDREPVRPMRRGLLTDQFNVSFRLDAKRLRMESPEAFEDPTWARHAYVRPAAHLLADRITRAQLTAFSDELPLPPRVGVGGISEAVRITDAMSGMTLRGVRIEQYDYPTDRWLTETRFDFLGGKA